MSVLQEQTSLSSNFDFKAAASFKMFAIPLLILLIFESHSSSASVNLSKNLMKTWKNNTFYAFRSIKYAEPPIGDMRFKAPVPFRGWNNITDLLEQHSLDQDGSDCPSPTAQQPYNEDCLYLNVYTKDLNAAAQRPVVIFIHPGGLYILSGSSSDFGPEYLLEEKIVLITFNYRLAHFGFTSIGSKEAIGNAGFKDQVLVLKWVQSHIHHFGGDKNLVTLMGDSAGALSISLHLVSPMSRNLFHRAFMMSSSMLPQVKIRTEQKFLIERLEKFLNCGENLNSFQCVKSADTQNITLSLRSMFEFGHDNPIYRWLPVIEPKVLEEDQFLNQDPFELLQAGNFNRVPILLSVTKHELSSSAMYLFEHRELLEQFLNDFSRIGPICLAYEANDTISNSLKNWYIKQHNYGDKEYSSALFHEIRELFSDAIINFPMHRFAQIVRRFVDVYFMKFSFRGKDGLFKCNSSIDQEFCSAINANNTVEHGDDIQYLFTSKPGEMINNQSPNESKIVHRYTKLVYSFAKFGYPYYGPEINVNRTKYDEKETFVSFNNKFEIDEIPFKQIRIWHDLFKVGRSN